MGKLPVFGGTSFVDNPLIDSYSTVNCWILLVCSHNLYIAVADSPDCHRRAQFSPRYLWLCASQKIATRIRPCAASEHEHGNDLYPTSQHQHPVPQRYKGMVDSKAEFADPNYMRPAPKRKASRPSRGTQHGDKPLHVKKAIDTWYFLRHVHHAFI